MSKYLLVPVACLVACATSTEAPPPEACLRVSMSDGSLTTAPPARVSLFFTVDTCQGVPVSGLGASDFRIFEDTQPVSAYESQQRIQTKGQQHRLSSLLLLDL